MSRITIILVILLAALASSCVRSEGSSANSGKEDTLLNPALKPEVASATPLTSEHDFQREIDSLLNGEVPSPVTGYFGSFWGDEPSWEIQFEGKTLTWENYVQSANKEAVKFSLEASRGFKVAFQSEHLFGVIVRSANDICIYAVTEEPYLPMDIHFSFDGQTYSGCGNLKGIDLRRR